MLGRFVQPLVQRLGQEHDAPLFLRPRDWRVFRNAKVDPIGPLDPTQKAARSCGMDGDVIGAAIGQGTVQQPLDISAVAHVPYIVDAHVVGILGPLRDQPMTHNFQNDVRLLEALAGLGVKK